MLSCFGITVLFFMHVLAYVGITFALVGCGNVCAPLHLLNYFCVSEITLSLSPLVWTSFLASELFGSKSFHVQACCSTCHVHSHRTNDCHNHCMFMFIHLSICAHSHEEEQALS